MHAEESKKKDHTIINPQFQEIRIRFFVWATPRMGRHSDSPELGEKQILYYLLGAASLPGKKQVGTNSKLLISASHCPASTYTPARSGDRARGAAAHRSVLCGTGWTVSGEWTLHRHVQKV